MKRPVERGESDEVHDDAPSSPPKPFDMFAGLVQEPLAPIQGELNSAKPTGALAQREDELADSAASREVSAAAHGEVAVGESGRSWLVYVLIAVVALVIGVVVGTVLK